MEVKKARKADLERKRNMFLQIGFVMALGVSLVAFEWNSATQALTEFVDNGEVVENIELPPLIRVKEPEMPKPPKQIPIEEILIVDNDEDIEEDFEFDTESSEDMEVDFVDYALEEEDSDEAIPFVCLENKPEFPGGEKALLRYLCKSVKYPIIAQENDIQGKVFLSFVIGKKGKVRDVKILRGVDSALDKEAVRVVAGMPDWKPGRQGARPVSVSYQVPINFTLQ